MTRSSRYPSTPWAAQRLYRPFLRCALAVALTAGFTMGALMLAAPVAGRGVPATVVQAHGFAQLFGWAGLAVIGVGFHVVPRFRGSPPMPAPWPQRATLALVGGAVVLRSGSALLAARGLEGASALAVTSAVLLLVGAAVFAAVIGGVLGRGTPSAVPFERWMWASLAWLLFAGAVHATGVTAAAREGTAVVEARWNEPLIHAALLGFVGNAIFAVSLRAIAGFASLRPRHARLERVAFALVNLGVGLGVAGMVAGHTELVATGGLVLALGLMAFTAALRIFERRLQPREARDGTYQRWERFVVSAYAWLAVGALLLLLDALAALGAVHPFPIGLPVLHVITLGFVTMMIVGFSARALPLFEGRLLTHHRVLDVALVALNASIVTRLYYSGVRPSMEGLAASGALGLAGLLCYAVAVRPLLFPRDAEHTRDAEEAQNTRDADVTDVGRPSASRPPAKTSRQAS